MPAVLTHKAIMLLSRERLREIMDRLQAKVDGGTNVSDLEHRVLHLARKAYGLMTDDEVAPPTSELRDVGGGRLFGRGVSRFAVMGSMGPDITGFTAPFNHHVPSWVFDLIHKGNPDGQREPVLAKTTDFALEIWRQASAAIDAGDGNATEKASARKAMRAYVLGHLCHVAGDVLAHPYINDVEWHLGLRARDREKVDHQRGELLIDAKVAQQVFLRAGTKEDGADWASWWPSSGDVPDAFFEAYEAALQAVYRARSHTTRPTGFEKFEEAMKHPDVLSLDVGYIRDGYRVYRHGIIPMGYDWGYWTWFAWLIPAMVPLILTFPLIPALPRSRKFVTDAPWEVDERGWFELLMLPVFLGSFISLFYGIWIASLTTLGVGLPTGLGLATASYGFIAGIVTFATVGVSDLPGWFRWLVLWSPPVGLGLYFAIRALVEGFATKRKRLAVLHAVYAVPFALMFVILLLFGIVVMALAGLFSLVDGEDITSSILYFVFMAVVIGLVIAAWILLPPLMRDAMIPETPEPFPAERRHFVRLFDDATLFHDAATAAPDLSRRFYPSERRDLLKLWWSDAGESMFVRSRRTHLEFSFDGAGDPDQIVPAPLVPMTPAEYARFLEATVKDSGGATGKLRCAVAFPADTPVHLPPGATFADEGDGAGTVEEYQARAERYRELGHSEEETQYVLRHAPRFAQAVQFGTTGPLDFDPREGGRVAGVGTLSSSGVDVTGVGTTFRISLDPGDRIRAAGQVRTVTLIRSDTELVVASEFNPALPAATPFDREGAERERVDGRFFVADPTRTLVGGDTIMDLAGDLGALLCLGATPHLLASDERDVGSLAGATAGGAAVGRTVAPVYQVFRNWSLDRRRENEWRMLVAGGAFDEKGGDPTSYDGLLTQPRPGTWTAPGADLATGDATARALGWVPLLRDWLRVAADGTKNPVDATVPVGSTTPSNQALSRAMAFLLDMPDPRLLD